MDTNLAVSAEALSTKPYNQCLVCPHLGQTCDGPNFLAMTPDRWVEWCRMRKDMRQVTNSQLADGSGLPKGTVDRVMAGAGGDVRLSTMQSITKWLVGGTWGQYPCHFAALMLDENRPGEAQLEKRAQELQASLNTSEAETQRLRDYIRDTEARHERELSEAKGEAQRKVDFLKEDVSYLREQLARKDMVVRALAICLGVVLTLVIGVLIYDKLNPDVGWFRAALGFALDAGL